MERNDADFVRFEKELASSGPLRRKGFSDELRRRIEERIDGKAKTPKPWLGLAGSLGTLLLVIATGFLINLVETGPADSAQSDADANAIADVQMFSATSPEIASPASVEFRSGLLIGLRADDREPAYRTLYIAPKQSRLQVVAQGSGILVPYKRDFWKIEPLQHETLTDNYRFFFSHPAGQNVKDTRAIAAGLFHDDPDEKVTHTEKVRFAANEYVSIEESVQVSGNGETSSAHRVWVTKIPLLATNRRHLTLNDALGTSEKTSDYSTDGWTIGRVKGKWVPFVADRSGSMGDGDYRLRELDVTLPWSVVNHDAQCCSWNEIADKLPGAIDAFTSPDGDMVAVVASGKLLLFAGPDALSGVPALAVKLKPKETVIMAQWATDRYVEEWAQKTAEFLR